MLKFVKILDTAADFYDCFAILVCITNDHEYIIGQAASGWYWVEVDGVRFSPDNHTLIACKLFASRVEAGIYEVD